jgi:hypothetical protein
MNVTLRRKVLLITGGSVAFLCTILYFTSEYHAYNVAVKHYRQEEYLAAIRILDQLSARYQPLKGVYLRSSCQYNLALESYDNGRYDESLTYLASIPESYMKYDDVKDLQDRNRLKQEALAQEREQQRQEHERQRQEHERRRQVAEMERKATEEATQKAEKLARLPADRKKRIEAGFSFWSGGHRGLTAFIKKTMNDPKSYEHVETTYADKNDYLIVKTTFRGKNAFGGVVVNWIMAKTDLDGNVIEIIAQGP